MKRQISGFKKKIMDFALFLASDFQKTDFWGLCSQMAFYLLMAFFPLLLFLINFIGRYLSGFKTYLFDFLQRFLPNMSYDFAYNLVETLDHNFNTNNYLLLLVTFFFASLAARAIIIGMNQNYGSQEKRRPWHIFLLSFLFTFLFAFSLLFIIIAYIIGENLGLRLLNYIGLSAFAISITRFTSFIFAAAVMLLAFDAIYVLAPANRIGFKAALPGAVFATIGINVALRIFIIFANHSYRYTFLYGSAGGLFALLVGIYCICFVLNIGGKINVYFSSM